IALSGGVVAAVSVAYLYGLREPDIRGKVMSLIALSLLATLAAAAVWVVPKLSTRGRGLVLSGLSILLFVELAMDARWVRFVADEEEDGQSRKDQTTSSDRKSTRLNSSHVAISYAVFCLKKK